MLSLFDADRTGHSYIITIKSGASSASPAPLAPTATLAPGGAKAFLGTRLVIGGKGNTRIKLPKSPGPDTDLH